MDIKKQSKPSSIATTRQKQRDNTERLQGPSVSGNASTVGYLNRQTGMGNTPLKTTTCTTVPVGGALHYDDIIESGAKFLIPDSFQTTVDKSDRVPAWNQVTGYSLQDPHAVNRSTSEAHLTEGYHKQPYNRELTMEDNFKMSMGGQVNPIDKMPTYSDANHVSSVSKR